MPNSLNIQVVHHFFIPLQGVILARSLKCILGNIYDLIKYTSLCSESASTENQPVLDLSACLYVHVSVCCNAKESLNLKNILMKFGTHIPIPPIYCIATKQTICQFNYLIFQPN